MRQRHAALRWREWYRSALSRMYIPGYVKAIKALAFGGTGARRAMRGTLSGHLNGRRRAFHPKLYWRRSSERGIE